MSASAAGAPSPCGSKTSCQTAGSTGAGGPVREPLDTSTLSLSCAMLSPRALKCLFCLACRVAPCSLHVPLTCLFCLACRVAPCSLHVLLTCVLCACSPTAPHPDPRLTHEVRAVLRRCLISQRGKAAAVPETLSVLFTVVPPPAELRAFARGGRRARDLRHAHGGVRGGCRCGGHGRRDGCRGGCVPDWLAR